MKRNRWNGRESMKEEKEQMKAVKSSTHLQLSRSSLSLQRFQPHWRSRTPTCLRPPMAQDIGGGA